MNPARKHRLVVRSLAVGATIVGIAAAIFTGAAASSAASHFSAGASSNISQLWHDM